MSLHSLFFRALDIIYDAPQNMRRCVRYKGVRFDTASEIIYDVSAPSACRLDLYRLSPEEGAPRKNLPVFFYIHGGGFEAGDKRHRRGIARWAASLGYAVICVNYGLAPEYKFPSQHRQLVAALEWTERNAERYCLDISRMIVAGDSAGAYFASVLACICEDRALQDALGVRTNVRFGGAVLNCGVYDLKLLSETKMILNLGKRIYADIIGDSSCCGREMFCNVKSLVGRSFPPSLVIHAEGDILCKNQAQVIISALREQGVPFIEFKSSSGADNHCFSLTWKGKAAERANALAASCLRAFLEGKPFAG